MIDHKKNTAICWLRRDLRLSDHHALCKATETFEQVAVVFIFDQFILKHLAKDDKRISFIHQCLQSLQKRLIQKGSDLIVLSGDPTTEICKAAKALKASAVFTNRDYSPYAIKRDQKAQKHLKKIGCSLHSFKDHVVFEENDILNKQNNPFKVFTPYKKAWLERLNTEHLVTYKPKFKRLIAKKHIPQPLKTVWSLKKLGFQSCDTDSCFEESKALKKFQRFLKTIDHYHKTRDIPALNGTSNLSTEIRFGVLPIRHLVRSSLKNSTDGAKSWLNELIWREFYQMILYHNPHIKTSCFQEKYNGLRWHKNYKQFNAWKNGQTGFPIVDAAMRHLNATGKMPNRLRMVTASFLVKDLLVDWRQGERYFAEKLLDYDAAANNGGWQWCASTGCDAQPYFRIFNPTSQSQKFDPNGTYIKKHCPELKNVPIKFIHNPALMDKDQQKVCDCILGKDYPWPLVDHSVQRQLAIKFFKTAKPNVNRRNQ